MIEAIDELDLEEGAPCSSATAPLPPPTAPAPHRAEGALRGDAAAELGAIGVLRLAQQPTPWAGRSRQRLKDRYAAPASGSTCPAGLSALEVEVARLVAEGLSNKAIGAQLHLSVRTVESHVRHVLAKIRLENRTPQVPLALGVGWIG